MQADEVPYPHTDRVRLQGPAIVLDADLLPHVVLDLDHTTDMRRRKLGMYKESGFPEIWVLVPWEASVRATGLKIHVRLGGGYREEAVSRAFPGWKAQEIHRASDRGADVGDAVQVGDEPAQQLLDHEGEGQEVLAGGVGLHAGDAAHGRRGSQWTVGHAGCRRRGRLRHSPARRQHQLRTICTPSSAVGREVASVRATPRLAPFPAAGLRRPGRHQVDR